MIGKLRGRIGKIAYSLGNFGQAVIFHVIGMFLIFFYVNEVKLDPALTGLAFLISYGIWNSINDPIAGYVSDRTRTRWGRRIPFVLFGTLPMFLLFVLIWSPPISTPLETPYNIPIFFYFLLIVAIFELLYTFVVVGWRSLFPEMFPKFRDRIEVSAYWQVFAIIALVVVTLVVSPMIGSFTGIFGTLSGWRLTAVLVGGIAGASFLISLLGSKERKEFSMAGTLPVKESFEVTLTNRSFLMAAFSILNTSWMWSLQAAIIPFAIVYWFGGTIADVALVAGPGLLVALLFFPIWRKICIRYGTKRTLTIATFLSVLFILSFVFVADTILKGMIIMLLYGSALSGVMLTREILIPDVIDEDQVKTGFRREGIYFGMGTFVDRFALALTGASMAIILGLSGFVPDGPQPSQVILGMRSITGLLLLVAFSGFLLAMKFYPLGTQRVAEVERKLRRR